LWLLQYRLHGRSNGTITNNLAKGTERNKILGGVQVGTTLVLNLTDPCYFFMVVKYLGGKKVEFTHEQHAHYQGVNPVLLPVSPPTPDLNGFALSLV
jgi:hypothetical protein